MNYSMNLTFIDFLYIAHGSEMCRIEFEELWNSKYE